MCITQHFIVRLFLSNHRRTFSNTFVIETRTDAVKHCATSLEGRGFGFLSDYCKFPLPYSSRPLSVRGVETAFKRKRISGTGPVPRADSLTTLMCLGSVRDCPGVVLQLPCNLCAYYQPKYG